MICIKHRISWKKYRIQQEKHIFRQVCQASFYPPYGVWGGGARPPTKETWWGWRRTTNIGHKENVMGGKDIFVFFCWLTIPGGWCHLLGKKCFPPLIFLALRTGWCQISPLGKGILSTSVVGIRSRRKSNKCCQPAHHRGAMRLRFAVQVVAIHKNPSFPLLEP